VLRVNFALYIFTIYQE